MNLLQKMNILLLYGNLFEFLNQESATSEPTTTGGQPDLLDLVDLTQRFFIGCENENQKPIQMSKMTKKTGWKSGIMFLWNIIGSQIENS